jgi:predicted dehydrogenase
VLTTFTAESEAAAWGPDLVFVTNPISMHVPTALWAVRAGAHVFVEKPLGDSLEGVRQLAQEAASRSRVVALGYQLRFHPAVVKIKELLDSGRIGAPVFADIHFGEWLPGMHPYEDYRESHAARRDQGGGVILCLSHEIDYATWLFGAPAGVFCAGGHLSPLEMDVEDTADMTLVCGTPGSSFPVHIHLDFLQKPMRRYCHVVGTTGWINWEYAANRLVIGRAGSAETETIAYADFKRNDMFKAELADFLDAVRTGGSPRCGLDGGLRTLEVCLMARKSIASGAREDQP